MLGQACQIFLVHVQTNILRRNSFLESFSSFHPFRNSSKKFSELWREFFGRVVTTGIYIYIGTFCGNIFSFRKNPNFFRRFRNLIGKSLVFWRKFFGVVVNTPFKLLKKHFWLKKQICSKTCNFNIFGVRERFSSSWQQSYGRLAKISWCMFRRTYWGEIIFFGKRTIFSSFPEFEQMAFRVLTRMFWQDSHNYILHVQKLNFRKNILLSKNS